MYKYYDNGPFLHQLTTQGLQLHKALQEKKILVGLIVLVGVYAAVATWQWQQQKGMVLFRNEEQPPHD